MTSASTSSEIAPLQDENQEPAPPEQLSDAPITPGSQADRPGASTLQHGQTNGEVPVSVSITQKALDQLQDHCYSTMEAEIGGVLLGSVQHGDSASSIMVKAVLPVKTDDHGPVHFTFSADSWALLHQDRSEQYPDLDIIGWYHTHPGLGVFFSADDVIVHSAAFVMPWHVGLVIDPLYHEGCWFGWSIPPLEEKEPQLRAIPGFIEILEGEQESAVSWRLVSARVWDSSYIPPPAASISDQVYVPANDWPSLPPISPWWGVLLGGTSLVLVLLLLLERLINFVK